MRISTALILFLLCSCTQPQEQSGADSAGNPDPQLEALCDGITAKAIELVEAKLKRLSSELVVLTAQETAALNCSRARQGLLERTAPLAEELDSEVARNVE